jgi:PAS domain-containing protein
MSHAPPASALPQPSSQETAATLAALEQSLLDPALPESTRAVIERARDALLVLAEEARTAHQNYRSLFDAVPDPVSIIAWDGTVLDLNKAGMAAYRDRRRRSSANRSTY